MSRTVLPGTYGPTELDVYVTVLAFALLAIDLIDGLQIHESQANHYRALYNFGINDSVSAVMICHCVINSSSTYPGDERISIVDGLSFGLCKFSIVWI